MNAQEKAAAAVMEEWLSHPQELGKKPAKLEIAGEFDLHDLHYYIFRFKKSILGSWKVAVCGGYEGDGLGHCGHIFSEMENYDPATAQEKCVAMVEKIRQYWMEQANKQKESQNTDKKGGDFLGFVLLSSPEFHVKEFRVVLKEDWGIECPEESIAAAQNHNAHLIVAVLGHDADPLKAGELFAKVAAACLKAPNVLGIYDCGTVWLPEDFIRSAMIMKEGEFPLTALVFVGLYQDEKGVSSWTNGLGSFGKDELEIISSSQSPAEVYDMMLNISSYLIQEGAVLRDGETIGLSAEQKLPITISKGVYVEGQSIKIGF